MNTLKRLPGGLLSVLALSAVLRAQTAPVQTVAAPTASDETVQMSPFVVAQGTESGYRADQTLLGSRSTKDLADIPGTISIIDREMIKDLNATTFSQVIDLGVAGVTQFQNFLDDMMIRGFRSQSMRDGIINSTSEAPQPMYDVDRVEVIKGPAAMLLGTNAFLGGAVNYIPRAPTAIPEGELTLTGHIDEKDKGFGRLQANVSGPIHKSDAFSANYRVTLGGLTGQNDKAIESLREYFVGAGLDMNFGRKTTISTNFYLYENDSYVYYDDFLDYNSYTNLHVIKLSPYSRYFSSGASSDAWSKERDGDFTLKLLSELTPHNNLQIYFAYFDAGYNESIPRTVSYASPTVVNRQYIPYHDNGNNSATQVDYLNHYKFNKDIGNEFYAGLDYNTNYFRAADNIYTLPAVNITTTPNYAADEAIVQHGLAGGYLGPSGSDTRSRTTALSYYVQDNVSLFSDRINLIGGLRWFYTHALNEDANFASDGGAFSTPVDYPPLQVYKVGAVVKPVSWLSLYWTKATNETPQSGFTNPAAGPPQPLGNKIGSLTEFGLKLNFKMANGMSIYGDWDHFQMAQTNNFTTDQTGEVAANGNIVTGVADNTSDGMEADLGFRVPAGSGHLDAFLTAYRADTLSAGIPFATLASGTPGKVYSGLLKYTFGEGAFKSLMFGGGVYGQGPRYELALPIHTPTTVNLFSSYNITKHWSVQANIDNLTDKIYVVRIATSALVEASQPGSLSVSTRYTW